MDIRQGWKSVSKSKNVSEFKSHNQNKMKNKK